MATATLGEIAHGKTVQDQAAITHRRRIQKTVKSLRKQGKSVTYTKQTGVLYVDGALLVVHAPKIQ